VAHLVYLVRAVTETRVEFPAMRREVMRALASLCDLDYQERVWQEDAIPHDGLFDDFAANVTCLYDDCVVLPEPETRLHSVLLPGDELDYLRQLGGALDEVTERIPGLRSPLADPLWPHVMHIAALALAAMVRAGGYCDP